MINPEIIGSTNITGQITGNLNFLPDSLQKRRIGLLCANIYPVLMKQQTGSFKC